MWAVWTTTHDVLGLQGADRLDRWAGPYIKVTTSYWTGSYIKVTTSYWAGSYIKITTSYWAKVWAKGSISVMWVCQYTVVQNLTWFMR